MSKFSRREFLRDGVAAFTLSFAAPAFLSELAVAQGKRTALCMCTALPVMQISPFWQMAISGAVILTAVIINARAERRPDKLILPEARRLKRV